MLIVNERKSRKIYIFLQYFLFEISPIAKSRNRIFLNQLLSNNWERIQNDPEGDMQINWERIQNEPEDEIKTNWERIQNEPEDKIKINWEGIQINENGKDRFDSEITNVNKEIKVNKDIDKNSGKFEYKLIDNLKENKDLSTNKQNYEISSLNRSIVFGEKNWA